MENSIRRAMAVISAFDSNTRPLLEKHGESLSKSWIGQVISPNGEANWAFQSITPMLRQQFLGNDCGCGLRQSGVHSCWFGACLEGSAGEFRRSRTCYRLSPAGANATDR
ncbi:hypothetical protein ABZV58_33335 [Nocardia sp. NPDC004654]|uniref:hypothetical protein n=1 Tax=Nocardia sp. NPDC004654 TaxID=3154776 RepID=UPI0033AA59E6